MRVSPGSRAVGRTVAHFERSSAHRIEQDYEKASAPRGWHPQSDRRNALYCLAATDCRGAIRPASAARTTLTDAQLDQLTAPIALYSDPLVSQILMAATYPLEVVEAQRWLQDPVNATLQGSDLATALQRESWDPSVKSLVPFPADPRGDERRPGVDRANRRTLFSLNRARSWIQFNAFGSAPRPTAR